ncbi:MAG: phasin family protein [Pseudomonas sp.]
MAAPPFYHHKEDVKMVSDQVNGFNDKSRELMDRAVRLNETLFSQFSKAAKLQMDSFQAYSNIAMEQSRKATEALSANDLKALPETQTQTLESFNAQVSKDWKNWQDYMVEARDQLKTVFTKTVADIAETVAETVTAEPTEKTVKPLVSKTEKPSAIKVS